MSWSKGLSGEGLDELRRVLNREAYHDEAKSTGSKREKIVSRRSNRKLLIIQTGGTIDKDYPRSVAGYAFEITEPAVKRILAKVNVDFVHKCVTACRKDSMAMKTADRVKILRYCNHPEVGHVLITHGTDTMIETAKFLADAQKGDLKKKVIVLTGAMRPEKFQDSDAAFNVGVAIGALDVCEPGVYICMNGRVRLFSKVERDKKTGLFVSKL
eukprot:CAMPEP_0167769718 /NCGR_PEP_ID=MMETSP0110_2-20121227/17484_1 /TAXON_ID=629695 /ORGANISM="Gymnochlora sp., Strain CCMP2014" /LENGTH=212 /DNA_ID=CAMNT_0007658745 /DNA_START=53 /DNA_END=692 /DNA_ORIENTATION=+